MDPLRRHHVTITGRADGPTLLFAHGFGCDQTIWARVAPAFEASHRVVCFDHVGSGRSERAAFDHRRHATVDGYADDLVELVDALELDGAVYVGHSIASAIGLLAAERAPRHFAQLVLVGGSARYLDDRDYRGGFSVEDIDGVLAAIDDNYLAWAAQMAPAIMGTPDRPEFGDQLHERLRTLDPEVARTFARATFLTDVRDVLPRVRVPSVIVHCTDDAIVPDSAAHHLRDHLPDSHFVQLEASGHCPLLSAPEQVVGVLDRTLAVAAQA